MALAQIEMAVATGAKVASVVAKMKQDLLGLDDSVASDTVIKAYASLYAQIDHPPAPQTWTYCHPILVRSREVVADEDETAAGLADDMDFDVLIGRFTRTHKCPIRSEEQMVTGCWHLARKKCFLDHMRHKAAHGKVAGHNERQGRGTRRSRTSKTC